MKQKCTEIRWPCEHSGGLRVSRKTERDSQHQLINRRSPIMVCYQYGMLSIWFVINMVCYKYGMLSWYVINMVHMVCYPKRMKLYIGENDWNCGMILTTPGFNEFWALPRIYFHYFHHTLSKKEFCLGFHKSPTSGKLGIGFNFRGSLSISHESLSREEHW